MGGSLFLGGLRITQCFQWVIVKHIQAKMALIGNRTFHNSPLVFQILRKCATEAITIILVLQAPLSLTIQWTLRCSNFSEFGGNCGDPDYQIHCLAEEEPARGRILCNETAVPMLANKRLLPPSAHCSIKYLIPHYFIVITNFVTFPYPPSAWTFPNVSFALTLRISLTSSETIAGLIWCRARNADTEAKRGRMTLRGLNFKMTLRIWIVKH